MSDQFKPDNLTFIFTGNATESEGRTLTTGDIQANKLNAYAAGRPGDDRWNGLQGMLSDLNR